MPKPAMLSPVSAGQCEALLEVGAHETERAEEPHAFDAHRREHGARAGAAQHLAVALPRRGEPGAAVVAVARGLATEQHADHEERRPECAERRAPAEEIRERAADQRSHALAEQRAGDEASELRLAALVREAVADERERQRDHGARRHAGEEAVDRQIGESVGERARTGGDGREQHRDRHDPQLAEAVADRAVDDLEHAVREHERRQHRGRVAHAHPELGGQRGEQRIGRTHRRARHEAGGGEKDQRGTPGFGRLHARAAARRVTAGVVVRRVRGAQADDRGRRDGSIAPRIPHGVAASAVGAGARGANGRTLATGVLRPGGCRRVSLRSSAPRRVSRRARRRTSAARLASRGQPTRRRAARPRDRLRDDDRIPREHDHEVRAAARVVAGVDAAAVLLDDLARDGETEARAAGTALRAAALDELVEHGLEFVVRNADAFVAHGDAQCGAARAGGHGGAREVAGLDDHRDLALRRGELQCVRKQVAHDLRNARGVECRARVRRPALDADAHIALLRYGFEFGRAGLDGGLELVPMPAQLVVRAGQRGHVDDGAREADEAAGRIVSRNAVEEPLAHRAVVAPEPESDPERRGIDHGAIDVTGHEVSVFVDHAFRPAAPRVPGLGRAGVLEPRAVHELEVQVRVGHPDRERKRVGRKPRGGLGASGAVLNGRFRQVRRSPRRRDARARPVPAGTRIIGTGDGARAGSFTRRNPQRYRRAAARWAVPA